MVICVMSLGACSSDSGQGTSSQSESVQSVLWTDPARSNSTTTSATETTVDPATGSPVTDQVGAAWEARPINSWTTDELCGLITANTIQTLSAGQLGDCETLTFDCDGVGAHWRGDGGYGLTLCLFEPDPIDVQSARENAADGFESGDENLQFGDVGIWGESHDRSAKAYFDERVV